MKYSFSDVTHKISTLSATKVAKKMFFGILRYGILCIVAGISINWWFAMWQWAGIFSYRLVALIYVIIFLIAFPILYIWQIRTLAIVDTVKFLRANYRDEIIDITVDKTIDRGKNTQNQILSFEPVQYINSLRAQFPWVVRRVVDYILAEFPLLQKIPEILKEVDLSNPDHGAIKQQILFRLQWYIATEKEPSFGSGIWKLIGVNIVMLVIVYLMIHYGL